MLMIQEGRKKYKDFLEIKKTPSSLHHNQLEHAHVSPIHGCAKSPKTKKQKRAGKKNFQKKIKQAEGPMLEGCKSTNKPNTSSQQHLTTSTPTVDPSWTSPGSTFPVITHPASAVGKPTSLCVSSTQPEKPAGSPACFSPTWSKSSSTQFRDQQQQQQLFEEFGWVGFTVSSPMYRVDANPTKKLPITSQIVSFLPVGLLYIVFTEPYNNTMYTHIV